MQLKAAVPLFKTTWSEFQRHNGQWLAAALAYFAVFAVAPLIIVLVEIAGVFLGGHRQALDEIFRYLKQDAGAGADAIQGLVTATLNHPRQGMIAQIIGWAVFVIAALGLFGALQFALNLIWDVKPARRGIWEAVFQRLWALFAILGVALMLVLLIGVNAAITVMSGWLLANVGTFAPTLAKAIEFAVSFGILWLCFSFVFEYLPDCHIEWRDVWFGGALTSLLFVVGQFLLGWYIGRAGISSSYGAFGALVVFLVWAYYSAQIVLFGAQFTRVYAERNGTQPAPATRGEVDNKRPSIESRA